MRCTTIGRLAVVGLLAACSPSGGQNSGEASATPSAPPDEVSFIAAVDAAAEAYQHARNDIVAGEARPQRAAALCTSLPSHAAIDWIGKVGEIRTTGGGNGVLAVSLKYGLTLSTWNNDLSDFQDRTLIQPESPLFMKIGSLSKGDRVRFSGAFTSQPEDCFGTENLTSTGAMIEPIFAMKFTSIERLDRR